MWTDSPHVHMLLIFPLLYVGCGHWSATVREEHKVMVSEGRVLKRTFGIRGRK